MRSITGSRAFISWADRRIATSCSLGHPVEQRDDLLHAPRVEVGQGLVEEQQLRSADEGVGDEHPLLLAAREASRPGCRRTPRRRRRASVWSTGWRCSFGRRPNPNRWPSRPERHQVPGPHRDVGIEDDLLGHVAERPRLAVRGSPPHPDGPGVRAAAAEDDPQQCRLADAVGPDEPGELAADGSRRRRRRAPIVRPENETLDLVDLRGRGRRSQVLRRGPVHDGGLDGGDLGHPSRTGSRSPGSAWSRRRRRRARPRTGRCCRIARRQRVDDLLVVAEHLDLVLGERCRSPA